MPSEVAGFKRLRHLKVVKLEGAMNEEDKVSLIELVSVEPLIVAKSHESRICRLAEVPKDQKRRQCYKFVEVEECSSELCFKHAHIDI